MSWQQYTLTFRLLAPLHIGWRQTGNLMQTRPYVTGKVFWAALTARLTRDYDDGADGKRYDNIGRQANKHFRFGYLYPALAQGEEYKPYYPWEPDFDYHFLDSYTSAALNYDRQAAEDGLLHETEFIAPRTRCDQPVYLTGDLYVRNDLPDALCPWQTALEQLQFGADRSYGWGRVALVQPPLLVGEPSPDEPAGKPVDGRLPAHLKAAQVTGVVGAVEPLIGWERDNDKKKHGWKLGDNAEVCYAPGSKVTAAGSTFQISAHGLWIAV